MLDRDDPDEGATGVGSNFRFVLQVCPRQLSI